MKSRMVGKHSNNGYGESKHQSMDDGCSIEHGDLGHCFCRNGTCNNNERDQADAHTEHFAFDEWESEEVEHVDSVQVYGRVQKVQRSQRVQRKIAVP